MINKTGENVTKILYVSPEVVPFCGTGGLGDVAGSLPKSLNKNDEVDIRVICPLYGTVKEIFRQQMEYLGSKLIPVAWRQKYMGVFAIDYEGVTYYFIDNEEYFKRDSLYGYYDDCERYTFFSRAIFESMEFTGFVPDIIHSNDWQSAMVPVFQDAIYHIPGLKTVHTIHNIEYQGFYDRSVFQNVLGLPEGSEHLVEFNGGINLLKGGITCANYVTTVSPTYAKELTDSYYAHGLQDIIKDNSFKFTGILNGIDTVVYNPKDDKILPATYDKDNIEGKLICKQELQKALSLEVKDVPLLTMISRLVSHKGLDLITLSIESVLNNSDCQLVILGTGDDYYEEFFKNLESRYHDRVRSLIMFNRDMSHKIYAAGDILLMPSKSEPCGLSQMIGCTYGNVPLVRATGGLNDSIKDCTLGEGNGFSFSGYNATAFYEKVMEAINLYYDKESFENLVKYDLSLDFSWDNASKEYINMYKMVKDM